jgi:hypothetical protein
MPTSTRKIPRRYVPTSLSQKDKRLQRLMIQRSRQMYTQKKYYTRKRVDSFKSKQSPYIVKAQKVYDIQQITPSAELARKTGCSLAALQAIVKKGQGAYYSSGSRPNQTSTSWGLARLASALTAGKAAAVDYAILEKGCDHHKKAFQMARRARRARRATQ